MATNEYIKISNNLKKYLNEENSKENSKENASTSISNNIKIWLDKSNKYLDELYFISNTDQFEKRQEYLEQFNKNSKADFSTTEAMKLKKLINNKTGKDYKFEDLFNSNEQ